jgi:hypothetical protein
VVYLIIKQFLKHLVHLTTLSQLHSQEGKIQGFSDVCLQSITVHQLSSKQHSLAKTKSHFHNFAGHKMLTVSWKRKL